MGDPRKFKNKYEAPKKLWEKDRIATEKTLRTEYGLKNIREVWIAAAELKKYRREARRLLSVDEEERKRDMEKIINRLNKFGILPKTASIEEILSLDIKVILERRLQTRVLRKGLAKTAKQARQLITHGFVSIGDEVVTIPSYLVTDKDDSTLKLCKPIDLNLGIAEEDGDEDSEKKEVKKEDKEKPKEEKSAKKEEPKKPEVKKEEVKEEKPAEKKEVKPKKPEPKKEEKPAEKKEVKEEKKPEVKEKKGEN